METVIIRTSIISGEQHVDIILTDSVIADEYVDFQNRQENGYVYRTIVPIYHDPQPLTLREYVAQGNQD